MRLNEGFITGSFTTHAPSPETAIAAFMRAFGLTVRGVARRAGKHRKTIQAVLDGGSVARRSRAGAGVLSLLFGFPLGVLLEGALGTSWSFCITQDGVEVEAVEG